jgi:hypothetical protein
LTKHKELFESTAVRDVKYLSNAWTPPATAAVEGTESAETETATAAGFKAERDDLVFARTSGDNAATNGMRQVLAQATGVLAALSVSSIYLNIHSFKHVIGVHLNICSNNVVGMFSFVSVSI